jgi:hypothetical protein
MELLQKESILEKKGKSIRTELKKVSPQKD